MRRGDVVLSTAPGDYGKVRPCVVVQANVLNEVADSFLLCPLTSDLGPEAEFRPRIFPDETNGLRIQSEAIANKLYPQRGGRIKSVIGRLAQSDLSRLNEAIRLVLDLD